MNGHRTDTVALDTQAEADRRRREAAKVAAAQRDIDAGQGSAGPALDAWLEAMENSDAVVPIPSTKALPSCG